MEAVTEEHKKKPRDGWNLVARIFLAIGILTAFALTVYRCRTEQVHVVRLQADSTQKMSFIGKLQRQADDALAFAKTYQLQRDSVITAKDRAVDSVASKLNYAEKISLYFQGLVANQTLPAAVAQSKPALTDERVVVAGLKTIQREATLKTQNDGLIESISVRDAKILALRQDKQTLKEGLVNLKQKTLPKTKQGFLLIKAAARKQAKEVVKEIDEVLDQSKKSELEAVLNN